MNPFDSHALSFINGFVNRSWAFDSLMVFVSHSNLLKGGVILTLFWWVWFRENPERERNRQVLLATLAAALVGLILARTMAFALPFRVRPAFNPALHLRTPYSMNAKGLIDWSSFPSDHAVLFIALATGLLFISRRLGVLAIGYALVLICFPRVYMGVHYPSDILTGALIGAVLAWAACRPPVRERIAAWPLRWLRQRPGMFYAAFFLGTFEIAALFGDVRGIGRFGIHILRAMLGHG